MSEHTLKYALHSINHVCPVTGKHTTQAPGEVFAVNPDDVEFFESVGAVREPDERELGAYVAPVVKAPTKAEKAAAAAAAVEAEKAAAADLKPVDDQIG